MNRIMVILVVVLLAFTGCAPEEAPAEPTPDLQEQMQTNIDMGNWMVKARYIQTLCEKATTLADRAVEDLSGEQAQSAAKQFFDHINMSDGLMMRIKTRQAELEIEKQRIEKFADKDMRVFANLVKQNSLNAQYIDLLSTTPEIHDEFLKESDKLKKQLDSIYSTLKVQYPQAEDDLAAIMAKDNMDYLADMKALDNIPTPIPPTTPTPDLNLPTPTPTLPPAQTWIDENGVMHMGHHPPENASITEVKSKLSGGVGITTPQENTDPTTQTEPAKSSVIWVDENGVTHMGAQAPEGVEAKRADEIKLMVE